jgi:proline iminopeptidase
VEHGSARDATTTIVPVDEGQLFVRDLGSGLPILVVHGGPDFDHEYLVPELDRLADQFRPVFYDQRGRGRSFHGERPQGVTIDSEINDLDQVRAWTGAAAVALLGHSWGGLLAMEYAIRHPDRISHLILLDTAPASHQDMLGFRAELTSRRTPEQSARMTELANDPAYEAGDIEKDAEYHRIHFASTVRRHGDLDMVVGRLRVGFTPEGIVAARAIEASLYAQTWLNEDYDLIPSLGLLRMPTLVIRGAEDFIPDIASRRIADAIPTSTFVEIADAGHFAYVEQAEVVRSTITSFLAPRA